MNSTNFVTNITSRKCNGCDRHVDGWGCKNPPSSTLIAEGITIMLDNDDVIVYYNDILRCDKWRIVYGET